MCCPVRSTMWSTDRNRGLTPSQPQTKSQPQLQTLAGGLCFASNLATTIRISAPQPEVHSVSILTHRHAEAPVE